MFFPSFKTKCIQFLIEIDAALFVCTAETGEVDFQSLVSSRLLNLQSVVSMNIFTDLPSAIVAAFCNCDKRCDWYCWYQFNTLLQQQP